MTSALREIGVPIIRWPGGCYASAYHWRWGAGARSERPARPSTVWRFHDTHQFGTTEFVQLCRLTGAEPLICVGVGRAAQHPTPDEAAQWVRYCNATSGPEAELRAYAGYPEPLNVTLWGLGNEVFAGIYDDPTPYAEDVLAFASAMRGADPRLRFVIVGAEREWLWDWNERLLSSEEVVRESDWISWHDYLHTGMCESRTDGSGKRQPYMAVIEHLTEVEGTIENHARISRGLELAVDEWNELGWELLDKIDQNDLPESYTLGNALYTAGFLNILIRHADTVTMANHSPAVNTRGLIYAGPEGLLFRPTYHVYKMLRRCAGATSIHIETESESLPSSVAPALDAAAALDPGNAVTLLVTNRHPSADVQCRVDFDVEVTGPGVGEVLTADSLDSFNTFEKPNSVRPVPMRAAVSEGGIVLTLPARSVTVVTFPASG